MFDSSVRFRYEWRDYQARVLKSAQQFIQDGKLHVVAAPGSGKTVLGLEIMRRIDRPTVILAPTIAIRNQWVDRFTELFTPDATRPDWVSTDIDAPAKVTVLTYQGLASRILKKAGNQQDTLEAADSEVFIEPEEESSEDRVTDGSESTAMPSDPALVPRQPYNGVSRSLATAPGTSADLHRNNGYASYTSDAPGTIANDRSIRQDRVGGVLGMVESTAQQTVAPPDEKLYLPGEEPIEKVETSAEPETNGEPTDVEPELLTRLKELGVQTIIVDEAHHLRNEWWKALVALQAGIEKPVIVALTATPPYDADTAEWKRYIGFCGPVDIEVSVPELVAKQELCPHQDYVYYALPSTEEIASVVAIRQAIRAFEEELLQDQTFVAALLQHPACAKLSPDRERIILEEPEYYTAMAAFLHAAGYEEAAKPLFRLICGRTFSRLPKFDSRQFELLLQGLLFSDKLFDTEANQDTLLRLRVAARQIGLVESRQVTVVDNKKIASVLRNSISKVPAICDIVAFEHTQMKDSLRCVILTDYIRKEFIASSNEQNRNVSVVGVLPIFEELRTKHLEGGLALPDLRGNSTTPDSPSASGSHFSLVNEPTGSFPPDKLSAESLTMNLDAAQFPRKSSIALAVLTGSIVIVPATLKAELQKAVRARLRSSKIKGVSLSFSPYSVDKSYALLNIETATRQHIVAAMTELFEAGKLHCIVGTKSLLGEGWDAPSINTLVLASFVGTSMLSNQMRGRAIRVSKADARKTADIWHVLTIMPDDIGFNPLHGKMADDLGGEYRTLRRRFDSFVAPSYSGNQIASGLERASFLPAGPYVVRDLSTLAEQANARAYALAADRNGMAKIWQDALAASTSGQMSHSMAATSVHLPRGPVLFRGFAAALYGALITVVMFAPDTLRILVQLFSSSIANDGGLAIFLIGVLGAIVVSMVFAVRMVIRMFRHFSPESSMKQVGESLLAALCRSGFITTRFSAMRVETTRHIDGSIEILVVGAQPYESDIFLDAMSDLISPIRNPRYLLQARGKNGFIVAGWNSFAVPAILSQKRKHVDALLSEWSNRVGRCRGVYTRSELGRKILLGARRSSLAAYFSQNTERRSIWS